VQPSSNVIESVGYVAGVLTTVAFVPQLMKTWRSQSAADLSLTMLTAFTVGILLWLVYGLALASWPLVLSNAITLALTALLLKLKVRDVTARFAPKTSSGQGPR
jgi:MtN3 and saliva related transmembrane protein